MNLNFPFKPSSYKFWNHFRFLAIKMKFIACLLCSVLPSLLPFIISCFSTHFVVTSLDILWFIFFCRNVVVVFLLTFNIDFCFGFISSFRLLPLPDVKLSLAIRLARMPNEMGRKLRRKRKKSVRNCLQA